MWQWVVRGEHPTNQLHSPDGTAFALWVLCLGNVAIIHMYLCRYIRPHNLLFDAVFP